MTEPRCAWSGKRTRILSSIEQALARSSANELGSLVMRGDNAGCSKCGSEHRHRWNCEWNLEKKDHKMTHRLLAAVASAGPLSPLDTTGSRIGREWWPDREQFRSQWYPLTFATIDEVQTDMDA